MRIKTYPLCLSVFLSLFLIIILSTCKKKDKKEETPFQVEKIKQISKEDAKRRQIKSKPKDFTAATYPTNSQSIRNLEQDIIVYFSREVKPDDFSFTIRPDPGEWKASWENMGRQVNLRHENPFSQAVQYEFEIVVRSENIKKSIHFTAYGPSTLQKIEEDETKGLIDLDTAWLYRLQTLFEPEKLPSKYQSPTPLYCGTGVMQDFQQISEKLKPQTLMNLKPYLVRPDHPESIYSNNNNPFADGGFKGGFHLHSIANEEEERPSGLEKDPLLCKTGPMSIWYMKGQKDKAEETRDYLDMGNYYGLFKNLLGKEPLSDGNLEDKGRDGRLDIYLVPIGANRETLKVLGFCCPLQSGRTGPAYIKIKISLRGAVLDTTLAHELFHAFQFAFDQEEARWWLESTAVWAEDLSNPTRNREQNHLMDAFRWPEHRLETLTEWNFRQEYGMYLFPFYLKREFGAEKIAEIWKACETTDALDAVDKNVPKGLEECFKHFALLNLDLGPYEGSYDDHNGPLELYVYHGAYDFSLLSVGKNSKNFPLPPLSATYTR
ncbi:hypothetical protein ACFLT2_04790 [Acidobacteriota bacterium]